MLDLMQFQAIAPEFLPDPVYPICFILLIWLIRFLKIFSYPEPPTVVTADKQCSQENHTKDILEKCPILKEK